MLNVGLLVGRFEGFIFKIEDFYRFMNFLEVCVNYFLKEIIIMFYVKKKKKRINMKKYVFLNIFRLINC